MYFNFQVITIINKKCCQLFIYYTIVWSKLKMIVTHPDPRTAIVAVHPTEIWTAFGCTSIGSSGKSLELLFAAKQSASDFFDSIGQLILKLRFEIMRIYHTQFYNITNGLHC